ncbi:Predicted arabinose efflux permease, MFS family [Marininema mesophilum]|uniref:Predicted arabinose efflux permease, MFS family n=1 Tax=Marininema mesophilum TaxID=1048340 RepID=A0A1H2XQD3_9BACL|nr:MFS transporter [Marininema mesophilum]SDW94489.1 Predicted arabinose efflux permease, MFS family [Marininema mesophilum]
MNRFPLSFRALWLGQGVANLADSFYIIAIVTLLYNLSGSATMAASIPLLRVGAQMTSGFIAPLLLHRFPLHRILLTSQTGQTFLLIILATMISWLKSPLPGLALVFGTSFLDGWTTPARNALVPRLLPTDSLIRGNSWLATTDQTIMLLGWSTGGLLVAYLGSSSLLWISVGLFIISCLALTPVRDPEPKNDGPEKRPPRWHIMKEGWSTILNNPTLRRITLMDVIETASGTIWIGAIILVFVKEILHRGETWWGWINASYYTGTVLGGLLILTLSRLFAHRLVLGMIIGSVCNSVLTLLFALLPVPIVSLVLSILMGPCYQLRDITQRTLFQQALSSETTPKVFAAHGTLMYGVFGLAVFVTGVVADSFGVRSVYLATAGLLACSVMIGTPLLRSNNRSSSESTCHSSRG